MAKSRLANGQAAQYLAIGFGLMSVFWVWLIGSGRTA